MDAEITIGRGQWFSDVIPVFNPNTIYNKWITGIGGTTTAINDGYTIIISPNVAGIVSKEGIENVVAVYGGIDSQRIAKRTQEIEEQGLRPVIISTPDSFWKVDDALGPDIYHRFKCVIDEIHCFQEAASYRDSLPEFIDIYFQRFGQKAVITATLSPLSHPLFEKWQTMRLVPQYEYRQPLKVYYSTNQLFASVTEFVESLPAEEKKNRILQLAQTVKGPRTGWTGLHDMVRQGFKSRCCQLSGVQRTARRNDACHVRLLSGVRHRGGRARYFRRGCTECTSHDSNREPALTGIRPMQKGRAVCNAVSTSKNGHSASAEKS